MTDRLRRIDAEGLRAVETSGTDPEVRATVDEILNRVRRLGDEAVREEAFRLGDLERIDDPLVLTRREIERRAAEVSDPDRELLDRSATRIRRFATAQRASLKDLETPVEGGTAGHRFEPLDHAGCYAPGGRYPLPSSVLMTAVTARTAGVREITLASPRPSPIVCAAALSAGVDRVLAVGGAQAVAALAYGTESVPPVQIVVGPGNRYVTAAKEAVAGMVSIDMLAGPSELLVVADDSIDPNWVAADLLAQAEHDPDARVVLLVLGGERVLRPIQAALDSRLETLPTRAVALRSLEHAVAVCCRDLDEAIELSDRVAPEHLQICIREASSLGFRFRDYGALFLGSRSAEVFGDYGVGPNHVLPTGAAARQVGGLSVANFLRLRTWLDLSDLEPSLLEDVERLARLEGLAGHAEAARIRATSRPAP